MVDTDIPLGYNIMLTKQRFAYVGVHSLQVDERGTPWVLTQEAQNIATIGTGLGLGALSTGKASGTITHYWGSVITPYREVLYMIPAGLFDGAAQSKEYEQTLGQDSVAGFWPNAAPAKEVWAIVVVERGFTFIGLVGWVQDALGQAWCVVKNTQCIIKYGAVSVGSLYNGPVVGTKLAPWGTMYIPEHAVSHLVSANESVWSNYINKGSL